MDDGSTDNSKSIIELYRGHPKISHICYNRLNGGTVFKQWKKGIDLAKGDLIWIAESDDWADSHFLEILVSVMQQDDKTALAYAQSYDVDEAGQIIESRINWTGDFEINTWQKSFLIPGKEFMGYLFYKNVIPNVSACIMRKEYIVKIFENEKSILTYKMCGDWFTWLLLADINSVKIAFSEKHLNYFRILRHATRVHNTPAKLLNRVLEEAAIFNSGRFTLSPELLRQKNNYLRQWWFKIFSAQRFSVSFFRLAPLMHTYKMYMLGQYILYRASAIIRKAKSAIF